MERKPPAIKDGQDTEWFHMKPEDVQQKLTLFFRQKIKELNLKSHSVPAQDAIISLEKAIQDTNYPTDVAVLVKDNEEGERVFNIQARVPKKTWTFNFDL